MGPNIHHDFIDKIEHLGYGLILGGILKVKVYTCKLC